MRLVYKLSDEQLLEYTRIRVAKEQNDIDMSKLKKTIESNITIPNKHHIGSVGFSDDGHALISLWGDDDDSSEEVGKA